MRKITFLVLFLLGSVLSFAQTARVQIIHNSPTPTVDIYAGADLLLDNFAFRTATPFIDVPADVNINIGVAPKDSDSSDDAIANFPVTFADGGSYVVIASGIVGGNPGFDLSVFDMGAEEADNEDNVGLLFFHGSPDAPTVDVLTGGSPIIDDVSFGEFQGYLNVPATEYILDVTPGNDNSTIVASYKADFSFWSGNTAVIFASGFLSGDDPAFEPWVALNTGGTFPLDLIDNTPPVPTARVQIIHNSPTPTVDIYANEDRLLNNFAFRTATPFIDVPADVLIDIGVAPDDSDSADDAIANFPVTFEAGRTYVVIANGIVGGNPGFDLSVFDMGAEEADDEDNVGLLFFHGSPDAPTVDVVTGGTVIIDDASYGDFQGYLNVPATEYILDITPGNDNSTIVASYEADFSFWSGNTAVIFASGFLSGDDPAFEPWVALNTGGTFPLDLIDNTPPAPTARVQIIHNSPTPTVDIYANEDRLLNNFAFRTATPFIDVPADVLIDIGVAPDDSDSADDAIANFPVSFEAGRTYVVIANGIVGGNPGFDLSVFDMGAEEADDEDNVGLLFFHGSPDAPTVDVVTGGTVIIDDASYGDFQGYLNVPATEYILDITPGNDNSTIVASYEADFSFWSGNTAVIFASGFLSGDDPAFEPWVALNTGGTFPLDLIDNTPPAPTARVQIIHNSPTPTVDIYANEDRLLNNFAFRTATPFIDVPADVLIDIGVAPKDSDSADDAIANFPVSFEAGRTYVVIANGIVGGNPGFDLSVFDMGAEEADDEDNVGLLFFHGSPDAPTVDVVTGGTVIIDDASYGDFQGYLNVPATEYTLDITPGNDNSTIVASYEADFSFWSGNTAVIFASGFLSGDEPAFEPWVALNTGGTFPLQEAHTFGSIGTQSLINNNSNGMNGQVEIFPNPSLGESDLLINLESENELNVSITSHTGQVLRDQYFGTQASGIFRTRLNLNDLPNGAYFVTVRKGDEVETKMIQLIR